MFFRFCLFFFLFLLISWSLLSSFRLYKLCQPPPPDGDPWLLTLHSHVGSQAAVIQPLPQTHTRPEGCVWKSTHSHSPRDSPYSCLALPDLGYQSFLKPTLLWLQTTTYSRQEIKTRRMFFSPGCCLKQWHVNQTRHLIPFVIEMISEMRQSLYGTHRKLWLLVCYCFEKNSRKTEKEEAESLCSLFWCVCFVF